MGGSVGNGDSPGEDFDSLAGLALPPEVIGVDQRRRIAAGVGRALMEVGYFSASVRQVVELASISRPTFYEHHANLEEAFCAAHAEALASLGEHMRVAVQREDRCLSKVAVAVRASLEWAAFEPTQAYLLVGELHYAGPRPGYCHDVLVARFAAPLKRYRTYSQYNLPPNLEEMLVGGLAATVSSRLRAEPAGQLSGLADGLAEDLLLRYVGKEKARRAVRSQIRALR